MSNTFSILCLSLCLTTTFAYNWEPNNPVPSSEYSLYECTNHSIYFTTPTNETTANCTQIPNGVYNKTNCVTDLNIYYVGVANMDFSYTVFTNYTVSYSVVAFTKHEYDSVDQFYSYQSTYTNCIFKRFKSNSTDLYKTVFNDTKLFELKPLQLYIQWCTIRNSTLINIDLVNNTQKLVNTTKPINIYDLYTHTVNHLNLDHNNISFSDFKSITGYGYISNNTSYYNVNIEDINFMYFSFDNDHFTGVTVRSAIIMYGSFNLTNFGKITFENTTFKDSNFVLKRSGVIIFKKCNFKKTKINGIAMRNTSIDCIFENGETNCTVPIKPVQESSDTSNSETGKVVVDDLETYSNNVEMYAIITGVILYTLFCFVAIIIAIVVIAQKLRREP
ncbi:hypothetical protein EIN_199930 [Entamoeba invadens IP1]|uniref:Uncharacterized protein n=1 Tax=Entamoeba invadens IP1 TaxID=370355 RepID=A0A0A1UC54_ENTIV|nr:hypothetical protein EIN_199930 [Entamoeba invadens IP1]ELP89844.1 hypothetical protein EIN_199930 [Entamoeba invadens IP1]|eukprot:XP_004256615.1 hypothetical protein EIN_199930 [Entamoeba invadens IP1]